MHRARMAAQGASDDGEVPRRLHRRVELGRDSETGQPVEFSERERAALIGATPAWALVRVFAADPEALRAVEDVRSGAVQCDVMAGRFVRRAGRAQRVLYHLLDSAASSEIERPDLRVLGVATLSVVRAGTQVTVGDFGSDDAQAADDWPWVDLPPAASGPKQSRHGRRYTAAAVMLARLGTQRCLVCGASLTLWRRSRRREGDRRRYCGAHSAQAYLRERADREAILSLLTGTAHAWQIR